MANVKKNDETQSKALFRKINVQLDRDELHDVTGSLQNRKGEPKEIWSRKHITIKAICLNCQYCWVAAFCPMHPSKIAQSIARHGLCARCLEGERIIFTEDNIIQSSTARTTKAEAEAEAEQREDDVTAVELPAETVVMFKHYGRHNEGEPVGSPKNHLGDTTRESRQGIRSLERDQIQELPPESPTESKQGVATLHTADDVAKP